MTQATGSRDWIGYLGYPHLKAGDTRKDILFFGSQSKNCVNYSIILRKTWIK